MLRLKFLLSCFLLGFSIAIAQVDEKAAANNIDITQVNVDNLSDTQVQTMWARAQAQGYTIDQLIAMARARGMQEMQAMKLRQRIMQLSNVKNNAPTAATDKMRKPADEEDIFGYTGNEDKRKLATKEGDKNKAIFGLDFFKNPKISFTPNLNMPTPDNYQIGPGG